MQCKRPSVVLVSHGRDAAIFEQIWSNPESYPCDDRCIYPGSTNGSKGNHYYLQSSSAIDLMMKIFEYMRRAVKRVAIEKHTTIVAMIVFW